MKVFSKKRFSAVEGDKCASAYRWIDIADGHVVVDGEIIGFEDGRYGLALPEWCIDYNPKDGDRVKLKNRRGTFWNTRGLMDCYKGKIVTVKNPYDRGFHIIGGKSDSKFGWKYSFTFEFSDVVQIIDFVDPNDYTKPRPFNYEQVDELAATSTILDTMHIQLDPGAYMPTRAHEDDAWLDLYAMEAQTVPAHGSAVFETGVHVQLPANTAGMLKSKSGLNVKHNITSEGVIDVSYTGGIVVKLYNHGGTDYRVEKGDKISQLVIVPILRPKLEVVAHLDETERGNNGFGSSGR